MLSAGCQELQCQTPTCARHQTVSLISHSVPWLHLGLLSLGASQVALVVKNLPANAGDLRDSGSIPGLGRSLGEGHGNPLQYSCLENPMDRGVWRTTAHGVAKSRTRLKLLSSSSSSSLREEASRSLVKEVGFRCRVLVPGA